MTKYARDEFDRVPETSTRQGVHRAVAGARRRSLTPILAAGFVALAIGLVAFLILPKLGFSGGQAAAVSAGERASASASSSPSASGPASPSPAQTSPGVASTAPAAAPPSATPSATPSAAAAGVDKTQPVTIYNGTTTAGLATRVGGTVSSAGWTVGQTGNWGGVPQQTSVIFYSGAEQKGNAEALGTLLGIDTLVDSAEFNVPLVVVLGPGFQ
ncbi:LytR C-terminal domain-containing protein [Arthrobacter sp. NPDC056886]|uniref:LytR C-terminal domain-containing protein n=1 Tax=Arthrobacter sp. NPDC056886 TaxID=3345960 RepID=UPI003671DAB6